MTELKNEINALSKELEVIEKEKLKPKDSKIKTDDIVRGCIIKIKLDLSSKLTTEVLKLTRQQFKDQKIKDFLDEVVYVDLQKNSDKILIRCKSPESVKTLLANSDFLADFTDKTLLAGDEEMEYFKKIFGDRNKKFEKKEKKEKKVKNEPEKVVFLFLFCFV